MLLRSQPLNNQLLKCNNFNAKRLALRLTVLQIVLAIGILLDCVKASKQGYLISLRSVQKENAFIQVTLLESGFYLCETDADLGNQSFQVFRRVALCGNQRRHLVGKLDNLKNELRKRVILAEQQKHLVTFLVEDTRRAHAWG
jgi:hypothetical protein